MVLDIHLPGSQLQPRLHLHIIIQGYLGLSCRNSKCVSHCVVLIAITLVPDFRILTNLSLLWLRNKFFDQVNGVWSPLTIITAGPIYWPWGNTFHNSYLQTRIPLNNICSLGCLFSHDFAFLQVWSFYGWVLVSRHLCHCILSKVFLTPV